MNFSRLIWCEPWLAPIVLNFQNVIETEHIPTAGVTPDGKTLYYNLHYWKSLKKEEQLGVQLHEVLHIVNRHAAREDGRNHHLWNIACDMAINYQIKASGYQLPVSVLDGKDDTAENIYHRLLKEVDLHSKSRADANIIGGDLLRRNADGTENCDNASTEEAIASAVQLFGRGNSLLSKVFHPQAAKADWRKILQGLVKSAIGNEMDYLSYEFDEFGICEDILSAKQQSKICVLVDESGSIADELHEQFLGELSKMSRFACVYASGFTDNTELNAVPLKSYHRTMTGGTDVQLTYQQACKQNFDCIIILTDGGLDFPKIEPKPTIWAMPTSFGRKTEVII